MSKYIPMDLVKSLSGKVCQHSDTYFAMRNGTRYTDKICHPSTAAPNESQTAQRNRFAQTYVSIPTSIYMFPKHINRNNQHFLRTKRGRSILCAS